MEWKDAKRGQHPFFTPSVAETPSPEELKKFWWRVKKLWNSPMKSLADVEAAFEEFHHPKKTN